MTITRSQYEKQLKQYSDKLRGMIHETNELKYECGIHGDAYGKSLLDLFKVVNDEFFPFLIEKNELYFNFACMIYSKIIEIQCALPELFSNEKVLFLDLKNKCVTMMINCDLNKKVVKQCPTNEIIKWKVMNDVKVNYGWIDDVVKDKILSRMDQVLF